MCYNETKNGDFMKRILFILTAFLLAIGLSACTYNPPQGYTEEHHTYEEILKFAKSIDSDASVSKEYTDTTIEAWSRNFREYPAVINGIECNVSSVGDIVWNEGFCAGEFAKQYYVIDTDYDYLVLKQIVSEKQPSWSMKYDDINNRYNRNNEISVSVTTNYQEQLIDEELNIVWQQAKEIYLDYNNQPIRKNAVFSISALAEYYNHNGEGGDYVKMNSGVCISKALQKKTSLNLSKNTTKRGHYWILIYLFMNDLQCCRFFYLL